MADAPAAIVTGASSGIGLETTKRLIGRGYKVAMAARSEEKLSKAAEPFGDDAIAVPTDVADPDAVVALVEKTWRTFGRIDVLVNNAGYAPLAPLSEIDNETIRRIFEVNSIGPAYAIRAVWGKFTKQTPLNDFPGPCIVNVSSKASADPFPGLSVYGGAKAAVNTLARGCAYEGEDAGIRAYSVAPGAVETDMLRSIIDEAVLPTEQTLSPEQVADLIIDCICGEFDDSNGETLFIEQGDDEFDEE